MANTQPLRAFYRASPKVEHYTSIIYLPNPRSRSRSIMQNVHPESYNVPRPSCWTFQIFSSSRHSGTRPSQNRRTAGLRGQWGQGGSSSCASGIPKPVPHQHMDPEPRGQTPNDGAAVFRWLGSSDAPIGSRSGDRVRGTGERSLLVISHGSAHGSRFRHGEGGGQVPTQQHRFGVFGCVDGESGGSWHLRGGTPIETIIAQLKVLFLHRGAVHDTKLITPSSL